MEGLCAAMFTLHLALNQVSGYMTHCTTDTYLIRKGLEEVTCTGELRKIVFISGHSGMKFTIPLQEYS